MSPEWIGGLIAISSAIITAGFTIIRDEKRMKFEMGKMEFENKVKFNKEEIDKLESRREELFNIVQNIAYECSITQNCVMANLKISYKEYEMHHRKINDLVLRAELLSSLYFPDLTLKVEEMQGLTNQMWGEQQHYFSDDMKDNQDKQKKQLFINEIVRLAINISEKCSIIMSSLCKIS